MNISSLSIQNKKRLSELLEDLTDILKRKDSLIENASKEIDRMSMINDMQSKLDAKGSEFTSIATPIDAKELQELVEKSDRLSSEKEEINLKSRQLNNDLEELSRIENSLMDEINVILSSNNLEEEKEQSLYVDSLNDNIYIIDAKIPEDKDLISQENCEIINCNISLIAEIAKLYNSNINKIIIENNDNDFDELKEKVEKYKVNKNNSYDKQLEILKKSFSEDKKEELSIDNTQETMPEEVSKDVQEETKDVTLENNEPVVETIIDTPVDTSVSPEAINVETDNNSNSPEPINVELENKEDNIVPIESLLDQQLLMSQEELSNNITPISDSKQELTSTIYVDASDKVIPNQIARATKDKLNNKIIQIFDGSFPKTIIQSLSQNNDNTPFNIENFINNKAA